MRRRSKKANSLGTILIVNDEPAFSYALVEILRRDGFKVHCAFSCKEAVSAINKVSPDMLLVDFMMPAKCGLDLIRKLRETSKWASTPIIVTSARTASQDQEAALEAGADIFLAKPFSRREFQAALRQYFPVPATGPLPPAPEPRAV